MPKKVHRGRFQNQGDGVEEMENSLTQPKYLFPTFLEDKKVFNLAEAYWRRMITAIAEEANAPFQPYINHHDSKGRKEYNANPIFDALFPSLHKAVRIIQDEPEAGAPDIATWMDTIELEEGQPPVPELVIALALSRESAAAARELIRQWVVEGFSEERMGEVIR